ncbi:MAG: secretin N-terminal domain-containing protein [Puniceicoccaceae bacterium]
MKNAKLIFGSLTLPIVAGLGLMQVLYSQQTSSVDRAREAVAASEERTAAANTAMGREEPDVKLELESMSGGQISTEGATYSINYIEEPIRNIIRVIANQEGLNVVIPEALQGTSTIKLQEVEWQTIFDLVLEDTGFIWKQEDRLIRITRPGAAEAVTVDANGLISVRFRNQPLREAVQAIADKVGISVVIPTEFPGTTSASFTGLTWRRALSLILEDNNFQWFDDQGIIRVRRVDERVVADPTSGLLSINADRVPFEELLTLIGNTQTPEVNIIAPPEVAEVPITLSLKNLEFSQTIELAILKLPKIQRNDAEGRPLPPTAFYLIKDAPTLFKIVDQSYIDAQESQPDEVRIYPVRYAQAEQLLDMLMPYSDPGARKGSFRSAAAGVSPVVAGVRSIAADTSNNILVVTAKPTAFGRLEGLIESLDQPIQQVMIETRFVEVSNVDAKDIGVNWSSLRSFTVGTGETGFTRVYNRFSSQNIDTVSTEVDGITAIGGSSNVRSRVSGNSLTDTTIRGSNNNRLRSSSSGSSFATGEETRVFESDSLGIQTQQIPFDTNQRSRASDSSSASGSNSSRLTESVATLSDNVNLTESVLNVTGTARVDSVVFGTSAFQLVLSALKENTDARLMSNPTVITMNGRPATIFISEILYRQGEPVAGETGPAQPGGPVLLENQPQTLLEVVPTVVGGDLIALNVRPEINNQVGTQLIESVGAFAAIPTIRQRYTESTVLLRSGYTLAIGGLMDEDSLKIETKVPVLGDIPLLGRLFRHERQNVQVRNQIIFITASLLNPQTSSFRDVVGEERLNQMGLTDRDVMGVGATNRLKPEEKALNESILQWRNRIKEQERMDNLEAQLEALRKADEVMKERAEKAQEKAAKKEETKS